MIGEKNDKTKLPGKSVPVNKKECNSEISIDNDVQVVEEKRERGRPTKYKKEYNEQVTKLCLLGAIDTEIADFFGVDVSTISNWKNDYPKFLEAIKAGKIIAASFGINESKKKYKKFSLSIARGKMGKTLNILLAVSAIER